MAEGEALTHAGFGDTWRNIYVPGYTVRPVRVERVAKIVAAVLVAVTCLGALPTATAQGGNLARDTRHTGASTGFEVYFQNGGGRPRFRDETRLKLFVDGEMGRNSNLLVKSNWTNSPEYLHVDAGEAENWTLRTVEDVASVKEVRVVLEGPYRYGGGRKAVRTTWSDRVDSSIRR